MEPAFQFETDTVSPARWVRCRVWSDSTQVDREEGEVFEIDEPVWLDRSSMLQPQDHIYWIRAFTYEGTNQDAWVKLSWGPPEVSSDQTAFIPVRPKHLRKLPEMHRIAAEASRPIP